jgi:hypothetical protein
MHPQFPLSVLPFNAEQAFTLNLRKKITDLLLVITVRALVFICNFYSWPLFTRPYIVNII